MSQSACIKCEQPVSMYQKYCPECVEKYGVAQDVEWHKNNRFDNWSRDRLIEFRKDLEDVPEDRVEMITNRFIFNCLVCGDPIPDGKLWCFDHRPVEIKT